MWSKTKWKSVVDESGYMIEPSDKTQKYLSPDEL
jgi:hypothetical protein